jgi:hypothetical protein
VEAPIGELRHQLILPPGNRYLWNFRTMAPFRGLGIYPVLLQQMIRCEGPGAKRFWIIHAPDNQSSRSGIRKAGFQYIGQLYNNRSGTTCIEDTPAAFDYQPLLDQLGFLIAPGKPAAGWGRSSIDLKPGYGAEPVISERLAAIPG